MAKMLKTMNEQISDYILNLINVGKLDYGDKVDEVYYAEQLGISRPTLHDAFIRMSLDGILKNVPRKGFFVQTITQKDVEEKYEIIGILDAYAAEWAMAELKKEDFSQMHLMVDKMQRFIDGEFFEEYYTLQRSFHQFYREKCKKSILIDLIDKVSRSIMRTSFYPHGEGEADRQRLLQQLNKEHGLILEAMEQGDSVQVKELVYAHWTKGVRQRLNVNNDKEGKAE